MGLRTVLAALAERAPARVFAVPGLGARDAMDTLRLDLRLELVDSPRAATIFLLVGQLPEPLLPAAQSLHDSLPRPRATLWWTVGGGTPDLGLFPNALLLGAGEDVANAAWVTQSVLMTGERPSDPDLLPDTDPVPWRGVGPYGHGGTGMTGGVPYGRPMTGRVPDRDGLELDQLPIRVGPLFPPFPPGLVLEVKLQGDIIQAAAVAAKPYPRLDSPDTAPVITSNPFWRALFEPVSLAELELARARHHLRWLGHALRVHGLRALGHRAWKLAREVSPAAAEDVRSLRRLLEATRTLGYATAAVGVIDQARLHQLGPGPVARAGGKPLDARSEDPAYVALGFEPVMQHDSDARARLRQRLDETMQALRLAGQAADRSSTVTGRVESPWGTRSPAHPLGPDLLALVPALVTGVEWGDAVTTIVSLDLDLDQ